ncbi:MAG: FHA domain-containing protein [Desmonostoc vinosum HA7617-LM4]|nr:FHA domain-containing protein [Desmonostoc vinosum HA7617-LM4]
MTNNKEYKCPKGHESTQPDFCSECGAKILGVVEPALVTNALAQLAVTVPQTTIETCPACSAPREPDSGDFCEICGYNFVTRAHGEVPVVNTTVAEAEIPNPQSPTWELVVTIDPSLKHPDSPEAPSNQPAISFRLDKPVNLIGRNSQARAIYPEIPLDFDHAVSSRHALLNHQADGTLTLRDIGSSNGTQLNGVELKPMVDTPLQDGDEFTLGHWTRITVKAISPGSIKLKF